MTKLRLAWAVTLVLVLLLGLAMSAPARLLSLVVPGDRISLQGLAGTVWQGSASRCVLRLPQGMVHLGKVRWSLDPLSLFTLTPRLTLRSEWGSQTIAGDVALRGARDLDVADFEARVSADLLRQVLPVAVAGSFSVQVAEFALRDGLPDSGSGRVVWQDAAWRSPQGPVPLGSYAVDFEQFSGQPLLGEVITLAGPMQANGSAQLEARSYRVDVLVTSEIGIDRPLENALSLMAAPEGDGYRILLEGDL